MSWLTETTQDYRRGYVEGEAGERDIYLLRTGAGDLTEYERGFADGLQNYKATPSTPGASMSDDETNGSTFAREDDLALPWDYDGCVQFEIWNQRNSFVATGLTQIHAEAIVTAVNQHAALVRVKEAAALCLDHHGGPRGMYYRQELRRALAEVAGGKLRRVDNSNGTKVVLAVVGEHGAVHYWHDGGSDKYGGLEVHWPRRPEWAREKSSSEECWLLNAPCWHDGSSLYASEVMIPLWERCNESGDMEPLWRQLEIEYKDRLEALAAEQEE